MPAMPVDSTDTPAGAEPGSPRWWLGVLSRRLDARRAQLDEWEAYYDGEHPLFFATPKYREAFGSLFEPFADNWCEVVVDASAERLEVEGFRVGKGADADVDLDLWDVWQRSGLDAESSAAMLEAIKLSESAVIIEPGDSPRLTVEHPSQVIVATDPGDRRRRVAALKKWQDDDGTVYATVYLPGAAHRFRTSKPQETVEAIGATFIERDDGPATVQYGRVFGPHVPVVPIRNRKGLLRPGVSDLVQPIRLQNAINKLATDLLVAAEFAAYRQRLLSGVEVPRYPEGHPQEGQPMSEVIVTAVQRMLIAEDPDARVQDFAATDLGNYVKAVEMFVQHLAAQTRTPPHYLMGTVVNASGDALKAAETGLVSKVRGKARFMGQDWEDVASMTYLAMGDQAKADATKAVLWADFENRSEAEVADAAVKLKDIGVPDEALWERVGASAVERARWTKLRDAEVAQAMALALAGTRPGDQGLPDEAPAQDGMAPTGANATGGAGDARQ